MAMGRFKALSVYWREAGVRATLYRIGIFLFSRLVLKIAEWSPWCWNKGILYILQRQLGDIPSQQMLPHLMELFPFVNGKVLVPDYALPVFNKVRSALKNSRIEFVGYSAADETASYSTLLLQYGFLGPLVSLIERQSNRWSVAFENGTYFVVTSMTSELTSPTEADRKLREVLESVIQQQASGASSTTVLGPFGTHFVVRPGTIDREVIYECLAEYIHWLEPRISGDTQIVDIGGHIGSFSVLVSHLVSRRSLISVYEPGFENFKLIQKNIELNELKNVKAFRMAVSDRTGFADLHLSADNTGGHRLHVPELNSKEVERVEVTTLKEIFSHFPHPIIDVLKIDVEGSEQAILMAAPEILRERVRYIVCEAGGSFRGDAYTVLEFLRRIGFECEFHGNESLMIIQGTNTRLVTQHPELSP